MESRKERFLEFLMNDLQKIENNEQLMNFEIMVDFVNYWGVHVTELIEE